MVLTLAVSGYRSLRDLVIPLEQLTVITGPNGSGKSSLYKAVRLLADVAQGQAIGALALEGGLQSTLWAGPEAFSRGMKTGDVAIQGTVRRERVSLKLGFADSDYGYAIDLGLPFRAGRSLFNYDPEIKTEALWVGEHLKRTNLLAQRNGPSVTVVDEAGIRRNVLTSLPSFESMMTHASDPRGAPELLALRERMRSWRFYDHFRTDLEAPVRFPQVGTRTPVLASHGADAAAALQTILEIGDPQALHDAIEDAFPDSSVEVTVTDGLFEIVMRQHGLLRPLRAAELSDGTLRYLLLVVALLTPRPPPLMVLNEPETSLHPVLLEPLARLIAKTSKRSQIIVVSHAAPLVNALKQHGHCTGYELRKGLGETLIGTAESPPWTWPKR
ncbi:AAA family ATPase [Algihabitans albus]|uniref:AAA family ATPase n=1 Tax=Algihabitans albus TaxID=2164067 RepID=UPI000E5D874F|nr:AAA family ATPase [Algihabitans albus]